MDYALFVIAFLWSFWAMYVLVMGIYRAHLAKRMTPVTLALSLPFVALGYVMAVLANITIASVVFVEPPQEILVTDRLKRHINHGTGWRQALASYVCDHMLDMFDPSGNHC